MEVFIKILTKQPDYPEYVDNHSKMVIDGLLEKEPKRRFSAGMLFSDSGFVFCGDSNHVTEYPCRLIYGPFLTEIYGHMTSNCFNSEISPFSTVQIWIGPYGTGHTSSNNLKMDQNSNWSSLKSVGCNSNGMPPSDYLHQMLYLTKIIPPRTRFHTIKHRR